MQTGSNTRKETRINEQRWQSFSRHKLPSMLMIGGCSRFPNNHRSHEQTSKTAITPVIAGVLLLLLEQNTQDGILSVGSALRISDLELDVCIRHTHGGVVTALGGCKVLVHSADITPPRGCARQTERVELPANIHDNLKAKRRENMEDTRGQKLLTAKRNWRMSESRWIGKNNSA